MFDAYLRTAAGLFQTSSSRRFWEWSVWEMMRGRVFSQWDRCGSDRFGSQLVGQCHPMILAPVHGCRVLRMWFSHRTQSQTSGQGSQRNFTAAALLWHHQLHQQQRRTRCHSSINPYQTILWNIVFFLFYNTISLVFLGIAQGQEISQNLAGVQKWWHPRLLVRRSHYPFKEASPVPGPWPGRDKLFGSGVPQGPLASAPWFCLDISLKCYIKFTCLKLNACLFEVPAQVHESAWMGYHTVVANPPGCCLEMRMRWRTELWLGMP